MLYRKQKKWIEFILRLFPFFVILIYLIYYLLAYRNSGVVSDMFSSPANFINSLNEIILLAFPYFSAGPLHDIISAFENWFNSNLIGASTILTLIVATLAHNVICNILFLFFDFINFILDFARKWLDGLYGKEK